jgi:hypothetical protein
MGALFYIKKEQLLEFYKEHNPANVANVGAILHDFSSQQILDMSEERYGAQPMTTPKAKGALTSLNLSSNNLKAEGGKIVAEAIKVTDNAMAVILAPLSCPSI